MYVIHQLFRQCLMEGEMSFVAKIKWRLSKPNHGAAVLTRVDHLWRDERAKRKRTSRPYIRAPTESLRYTPPVLGNETNSWRECFGFRLLCDFRQREDNSSTNESVASFVEMPTLPVTGGQSKRKTPLNEVDIFQKAGTRDIAKRKGKEDI